MGEAITAFRGDYEFLSNFSPSVVELDGVQYPTIEHAFQATKTHDFSQHRAIRNASTPSEAKRLGRKLKRREDWFDISLEVMEDLVRQKFTRYPDLGSKLLATGDAELIEGNTWSDKFYGAIWDSKQEQWIGENHLGKILMKIRAEFQEQS